jgi:hypothetical protein
MNDQLTKVYISGALTSVENVENLKRFYEAIGRICSECGLQPYIPHLHTDPVKHPNIQPEQVWKTDKECILSSALVVAYVSTPSLGVGMELAYAEEYNIPIILMYEMNQPVSRMVRGLPEKVKIAEVAFEGYDNGLSQLRQVIRRWQKR